MSLQAYQQTMRGHKLIKHLPESQREIYLIDYLDAARKIMGQFNNDPMIMETTVQYVDKLITEKYCNYSIDEVQIVLEMGGLGQLGEKSIMSARTVSMWFTKYESEIRPVFVRLHRSQVVTLSEPSNVRKLTPDEAQEYFIFALNDYKVNGMLYSFTYDILCNHGYTNLFEEKKKHYMELADRKFSTVASDRQREQPAWKKFASAVDLTNNRIEAYAKRIALEDFFKSKLNVKES
jgi:hypothetical protein